MKNNLDSAVGVIRRIDDLGRVVIPREIRMVLGVNEGDPLEIFCDNTHKQVMIRKYGYREEPNYQQLWDDLKVKMKNDEYLHVVGIMDEMTDN